MFSLNSLTSVTKRNILGNVPLHTIPPISGLEIMVHLIPTWMNGISRLMCLTEHLILQFLDIRHTDPPIVPQHTFLILRKTRRLLFLDIALNLLDLCHTQFLCQNRVLIVCMTQDQMFHTYGQKGSQKTKCHNIKYNYYRNVVFID
jgi:hypothetical protein